MRARIRPSCSSELTRDCCCSSESYWRDRSSSTPCRPQVGRRLVQRTAELLQGGEAVQFQRIELLVGLVLLALVAGDDLRLGFQVESAQLVAQSRIGALQFAHGTTEGAQLLFQARAVDRHFTGMVDQAVEQVGAHAHLLLLRARQRIFIDHAFGRQRCRQRRIEQGRQRARGLCGHGLDLAGRTRAAAGDIGGGADLEGLDQVLRRLHHAVGTGAGQQLVQAVEAALQQLHVAAFDLGAAGGHRFQQRFDAVAKIADGVDAGHACATLQGVQVTLQAGQHLAVLRRIAQLADQAIAVVEQVLAFLDEDVDQFAVVHAEVERIGAVRGIRQVVASSWSGARSTASAAAGSASVSAVPWPGASSSSKKRTGSAVACVLPRRSPHSPSPGTADRRSLLHRPPPPRRRPHPRQRLPPRPARVRWPGGRARAIARRRPGSALRRSRAGRPRARLPA
jgi:hypothetical protein